MCSAGVEQFNRAGAGSQDREMGKLRRPEIAFIRCRDANLRVPGRERDHDLGTVKGVKLGQDVVEQQHRRLSGSLVEQIQLGQLYGDDRKPLLPPRSIPSQINSIR